jgi:outer membrane lipase/esterase
MLTWSASMADAPPGLFVFGDSLSDPGNAFVITGDIARAPYEPVPAAPYDIGGHHFTDGKTWAEVFAQRIGRSNGGKPAFRSPRVFGNYAVGGARARPAGDAPSATDQVSLFLQDHGNAPGDALYVLQFGGNDVRDALQNGPVAGPPLVLEAVATLIANIVRLHDAGAREFLVVNSPDLGKTPIAGMLGATVAGTAVSGFYNLVLESGFAPLGIPGLAQLETSLPGVTIHRLDLFALINDLVAMPGSFGIDEVDMPCLSFGVPQPAKCRSPSTHLFWDAIHPTRAAHAIVADEAALTSGRP